MLLTASSIVTTMSYVIEMPGTTPLAPRAADVQAAGWVVDALFGIGLERPISGAFLDLINTINALRVETFEARRLNQYRLKGRIGAGGMGVVHLAEHELLKRPCAIKLIAPGRRTAADPSQPAPGRARG